MATDKTIDSLSLLLFDNWPMCPSMLESLPTDGFLGATHHNVTAAPYKAGTKCFYWNAGDGADAGVAGWATFIYLKGSPVTEANPTCAAKQVVLPDNAENLYQVTNDKDQCILNTGMDLGAYMTSIMTFTYTTATVPKYGWFWCGGICPEVAITDFGGTFETTGTVAAGEPFQYEALSADQIGLGLHDSTLGIAGVSLIIDA